MAMVLITDRDFKTGKNEDIRIQQLKDPEPHKADAEIFATLEKAHMILVDARRITYARAVVRMLMRRPGDLYLKPLFLYSGNPVEDSFLEALVDGITDLETTAALHDRADLISERMTGLSSISAASRKQEVTLRFLRRLYTRGRKSRPYLSPRAKSGFEYPFLALQFEEEDQDEVLEIINEARKDGLLDGDFIERTFLCPECSAAFLLTRETCVKCSGSRLSPIDVVHHFVCAYVGPEEDFTDGTKMVCPKCNDQLRHIGVDYDKPSMVYRCLDCGEQSQDAYIRSLCVHCGQESPIEELREHQVTELNLSPKGEHIAVHGFSTSIKDLLRLEGVVEYDVFKVMLNYEIPRVARSGRPSALALFRFENFRQIVQSLRSNRSEVFNEVAGILKTNLRNSDIISYYNDSTVIVLFTETPPQGASIIVGRINKLLIELISDNTENLTPEIHSRYVSMSEYKPAAAYLDELFAES